MKLGFVSGRMMSVDDDGVWMDAGVGRLVDALQQRCDALHLAMSRAPARRASHDHRCQLTTRHVHALPHMPSTVRSLRFGGACRQGIAWVEAHSDVTVVQLPFAPPWALVPATHPRVYHACADVPAVVRASAYYTGVKRAAAVGFADFMHTWQRNLIAGPQARLVANGEALRARLGGDKGRAVLSSTLRHDEVDSVQRRRAPDAPLQLLFVGYLRPEKGLDVLVDAYARVLDAVPNAELVVVGARDLSEGGAEQGLRDAVARLHGRGRIALIGQLPFGPSLFQAYADADVVVVPSRSEGTPRVLLEARAFRCPVVASAVGGIPSSVTDGEDGLLVPPGDAMALANALLRLAKDDGLRQRLVMAGLQRARDATVDAFADVIVGEARALREQG